MNGRRNSMTSIIGFAEGVFGEYGEAILVMPHRCGMESWKVDVGIQDEVYGSGWKK